MSTHTESLNKSFITVDPGTRGGEDPPGYKPGSATAKTVEPHKCNIHLGNEALDSYHKKTCPDH